MIFTSRMHQRKRSGNDPKGASLIIISFRILGQVAGTAAVTPLALSTA